MTFDEALSEAVCGAKVRAVNMQPGVCVHYEFAGFRILFPNGDGSGYSFKDIDKESEWEYLPEPEPVKVPTSSPWLGLTKAPEPMPEPPKPKRRARSAWEPPAVIDDIEDAPAVELASVPEAKLGAWGDFKPACKHSNVTEVWGKVKCNDCGEEIN